MPSAQSSACMYIGTVCALKHDHASQWYCSPEEMLWLHPYRREHPTVADSCLQKGYSRHAATTVRPIYDGVRA